VQVRFKLVTRVQLRLFFSHRQGIWNSAIAEFIAEWDWPSFAEFVFLPEIERFSLQPYFLIFIDIFHGILPLKRQGILIVIRKTVKVKTK